MLLKNYQDHVPINLYITNGELEIFSSYIQNTVGLHSQQFLILCIASYNATIEMKADFEK